jgi:hypothetical protein
MKHKVSELEGALLDAAVAEALGMVGPWITDDDDMTRNFNPSTDWSDGGPIIERERIAMQWLGAMRGWDARCDRFQGRAGYAQAPTPLVAAMRAYVASKLGDEVDLP